MTLFLIFHKTVLAYGDILSKTYFSSISPKIRQEG